MDTITDYATRAATAVAALLALPQMCGPAGDADTGDMNRDWACKRAHKVYMLHVGADNLRRDAARVIRCRNAYRARSLSAYVVEEVERRNRIIAICLAELAECTHAPEARQEMTVEESLPDCSC